MKAFFRFLASSTGRLVRAVAGLILIVVGIWAIGGVVGWILAVAAGAWRLLVRRERGAGVLLWAGIPAMVLLALMPARWPRYFLPSIPVLAVLRAQRGARASACY